jgi:prepilin signal peptidase PulO-like enzyme (type II secretory pathway)
MPNREQNLAWDIGSSLYAWQFLRNVAEMGGGGAFRIPGQGILSKAVSLKSPSVGQYLYRPVVAATADPVTARIMGDTSLWTAGKALMGKPATYGLTRGAAAKAAIGKAAGFGLKALGLYYLLSIPAQLTWGLYQTAKQHVKSIKGLEFGGYFPETRMSLTSRQRTLQAISSSNLQARSAIGSEAFLCHR